jgi:hypothetical protein
MQGLTFTVAGLITLAVTWLAYQMFGVLGLVLGWGLMIIPTVSYWIGLPFALVIAAAFGLKEERSRIG